MTTKAKMACVIMGLTQETKVVQSKITSGFTGPWSTMDELE